MQSSHRRSCTSGAMAAAVDARITAPAGMSAVAITQRPRPARVSIRTCGKRDERPASMTSTVCESERPASCRVMPLNQALIMTAVSSVLGCKHKGTTGPHAL